MPPLIPFTFASQTGPIPLSELDTNFLTVPSCPSIAALRANTQSQQTVSVQGYYPFVFGGGGLFVNNTNDTTSPDNGGTIIVDAVGQRWYRMTGGQSANVQWFGAYGDNVHDDTAAINSAIALGTDLSFPNTGNPYLLTVASGLNPIGAVSLYFQPGAMINHSGFGATIVYSPGGNNIATRLENVSIQSTTAAVGLYFKGGTGLTLVDNLRIYPFTGGTPLKFSQTFQYTFLSPYLRNCASSGYLIDIDNSISGTNNPVNEVKFFGGILANDSGTSPATLVNMRIGNNWRWYGTSFFSHGSANIGIDFGNDNLQAIGPEFITVDGCHFEGNFTNVVRVGNGTYQAGNPRDFRFSGNDANGTITTVYALNNVNSFFLQHGVWPTLTGFNYTIGSGAAGGIVMDCAYNSSNVSDNTSGANATAYYNQINMYNRTLNTGFSGFGQTTNSWRAGVGSPSGALSGGKGDLYSREDGTIGSNLYVCNAGTTWTAVSGV